MTDGEIPTTSADELHDELKGLLQRAHSNGIDVEGGWECRNGTSYPDWDVLVTEVEKPAEST